MPLPLYRQGQTPIPIEQEVGWAPELHRMVWRQEKSLALSGITTHTLVTILTTMEVLDDAEYRKKPKEHDKSETLCHFIHHKSNMDDPKIEARSAQNQFSNH